LLLPVTGTAGSDVVDALGCVTLDVVEVAGGVLLHADAPTPTATTPKATSSLRTLRGYPRGPAGALAPLIDSWPSGHYERTMGAAQLNPARLQMWSAIASDAVAAGEGALRTSRMLPLESSQKSSARDPARSIARARGPAPAGSQPSAGNPG